MHRFTRYLDAMAKLEGKKTTEMAVTDPHEAMVSPTPQVSLKPRIQYTVAELLQIKATSAAAGFPAHGNRSMLTALASGSKGKKKSKGSQSKRSTPGGPRSSATSNGPTTPVSLEANKLMAVLAATADVGSAPHLCSDAQKWMDQVGESELSAQHVTHTPSHIRTLSSPIVSVSLKGLKQLNDGIVDPPMKGVLPGVVATLHGEVVSDSCTVHQILPVCCFSWATLMADNQVALHDCIRDNMVASEAGVCLGWCFVNFGLGVELPPMDHIPSIARSSGMVLIVIDLLRTELDVHGSTGRLSMECYDASSLIGLNFIAI